MTGLEKIREERGLSRKNIIELLYGDKYIISETTIYNHERGKSIEKDTIERLAKVLRVTVEKIV